MRSNQYRINYRINIVAAPTWIRSASLFVATPPQTGLNLFAQAMYFLSHGVPHMHVGDTFETAWAILLPGLAIG
jgi:hypothetical protein